jgi:hypothetical protein
MAGLVPAIHVLTPRNEFVDARDKPGHDDIGLRGPQARPENGRDELQVILYRAARLGTGAEIPAGSAIRQGAR